MKYLTGLLALVLTFCTVSCEFVGGEKVKGDGKIVTEQRSVGAFNSVEADGAVELTLVANNQGNKVEVRVDQNLQPFVIVEVKGGVLKITQKPGYNLRPSDKIAVYVVASHFRKLEVSGACQIKTEEKLYNSGELEISASGAGQVDLDLHAPKVKLDLSGAGEVKLKGETQHFELKLTGAADAKCKELLSEYGKVSITGAGAAELFASVRLEATISGAGSVKYWGNPTFVTQNITGAGSISKVVD